MPLFLLLLHEVPFHSVSLRVLISQDNAFHSLMQYFISGLHVAPITAITTSLPVFGEL